MARPVVPGWLIRFERAAEGRFVLEMCHLRHDHHGFSSLVGVLLKIALVVVLGG